MPKSPLQVHVRQTTAYVHSRAYNVVPAALPRHIDTFNVTLPRATAVMRIRAPIQR
ncbi:hypothetical protein BU23DRAFT_553236 [Bimuria novae-zelandiae CBS 107.79]|uniref:Uncharacterized protein n=1 Tax=Bimuria novae-zelandiae CBS 107.79 TaxID=1447943 RepID=A0A6A5VDX8_9PLEO|nr:hypothetical protein BU23DRAFT_553236 [Bimuria novae-zelandiae CBS 107.79]